MFSTTALVEQDLADDSVSDLSNGDVTGQLLELNTPLFRKPGFMGFDDFCSV